MPLGSWGLTRHHLPFHYKGLEGVKFAQKVQNSQLGELSSFTIQMQRLS